MAACDEQLCEMKEVDLQPVELWEDNHSHFEQEVQEKSHKYKSDSPFFKVVSQIRGTFIIIINYYTTFPEFSNTQEALNLTFGAMDELENIKKAYLDDEPYYLNLLKCMKDLANKVHMSCISTNVNISPPTRQTVPKSSVLKQPVFQLQKKPDPQENDHPGKRKINESNSGKKPRKEEIAPSVSTQNKFQVLADPDETEEATPSLKELSSDNQCCEMEAVESNETTVTARTAPKKEPRPPPITTFFSPTKKSKPS